MIRGWNHAADGGGIYNAATLTIIGSTVSDNVATETGTATGGGIAVFSGTTTIIDSTLSGNDAFDTDGPGAIGGAIYSDDGTFVMRGVTIAGNSDDGTAAVYLGGSSTATMSNVIVSDVSAGVACAGNIAGLTDDHSLANDASCGLPVANPLIGALANNGGQTNTHALSVSSPARNAGAGCWAADERGVARDGVCDIGAFEYFRPRLTVVKRVVNNQGGTLQPADFSVHVRFGGTDVAGSRSRASPPVGATCSPPARSRSARTRTTATPRRSPAPATRRAW